MQYLSGIPFHSQLIRKESLPLFRVFAFVRSSSRFVLLFGVFSFSEFFLERIFRLPAFNLSRHFENT